MELDVAASLQTVAKRARIMIRGAESADGNIIRSKRKKEPGASSKEAPGG